MKIYTRTGDDGTTGLQGGRRVSKAGARIAAYGAVDEANSAIGLAAAEIGHPDIAGLLGRIQSDLFVAGADLSDPGGLAGGNRVTAEMVAGLEDVIDRYEADLPPLANFILPGGEKAAAIIHMARAVARRAEARAVALAEGEEVNGNCIAYLNRLSDLLFVLARTANLRAGTADVVWRA